MKKSFLLVFGLSLAINVILGVFLLRLKNSSVPLTETTLPESPAAATSTPKAPLPPKADSILLAALESGDLPALVARLRREGFPPDIIRAIVGAELGELFITRRKELDPEEETRPFWKTRPLDPKINAELSRLSREHAKLLRDVLGDDAQDPLALAAQNRRFDGVPPEKLDKMKRIMRDYDDMRSDAYAVAYAGGMAPAANREKLAAIDKAQREDIAQLLSPAELLEYNLRSSPTAAGLRNQLSAFQPSEAEFRTLYQLQAAFNEQNGNPFGPMSPEQMRQRTEAQKQLTEQIKAALGPERAADYVRASDPNYRQTSQLVARLQLPTETSNQVWSVQQDIQQRSRALAANSSLSTEERTQQLAALTNEAEAKISATLGARGFESYKQYGGQWMQQLQSRPGAEATVVSPGPVFIFAP